MDLSPALFQGKKGRTDRKKVGKEERKAAREGSEDVPGWVLQGKMGKRHFICFYKFYKVNAKSKTFWGLMVLFSEILVGSLLEHRKLLPGKKEGKL